MAAPNSILSAALEAMDHQVQLLPDLAGQAPAEGPEEGVEVAESVQPFVSVPGQRALHASPIDIEAGQIEAVGGGNETEGISQGRAAAVDTIDHPLQDAGVLAIARPEEAALRVAPEPVHPEDFRRVDQSRPHGKPVREVAPHVVAAERDHGHGIATDHADLAGDGRGGLRAHGRPEEYAVLAAEAL